MDAIVQSLASPALPEAIEDNFIEEVEIFGRALPGGEVYRDAEIARFTTQRAFFNGVHHARFARDDKAYVDAKIAIVLAYFKARDLPFVWTIGPSTYPLDLGERLLEHGFTFLRATPMLVLDISTAQKDASLLPDGLIIQEARDAEELRPFLELEMLCFDAPREIAQHYYNTYVAIGFGNDKAWHHYLGILHGRPVAITSLLLHAGVAGIYGVGTIPEFRRQGIGNAMTRHALSEARARGYRIATLTPTEMSLRIYQQLGFQEHDTMYFYSWTPERSSN